MYVSQMQGYIKWEMHGCAKKVHDFQFGQSTWVTCNLVNRNFSETWILQKTFVYLGARRLVTSVKEIPIGMFVFCLIIYFVRDWQHLHYWTAAACALGLPAYFW